MLRSKRTRALSRMTPSISYKRWKTYEKVSFTASPQLYTKGEARSGWGKGEILRGSYCRENYRQKEKLRRTCSRLQELSSSRGSPSPALNSPLKEAVSLKLNTWSGRQALRALSQRLRQGRLQAFRWRVSTAVIPVQELMELRWPWEATLCHGFPLICW